MQNIFIDFSTTSLLVFLINPKTIPPKKGGEFIKKSIPNISVKCASLEGQVFIVRKGDI